jgi:hypothetical protein
VRRRLFNICAAASLVLCVATAVLWVRSYPRSETFSALKPGGFELSSHDGRLDLFLCREFPYESGFAWTNGGTRRIDGDEFHQYSGEGGSLSMRVPGIIQWGEGYTSYRVRNGASGLSARTTWQWFAFPHWLVFVISAAPALYWFFTTTLHLRARRRQRRRQRANQCLACGYDLRASSDRCPECGLVASPRLSGGTLCETT